MIEFSFFVQILFVFKECRLWYHCSSMHSVNCLIPATCLTVVICSFLQYWIDCDLVFRFIIFLNLFNLFCFFLILLVLLGRFFNLILWVRWAHEISRWLSFFNHLVLLTLDSVFVSLWCLLRRSRRHQKRFDLRLVCQLLIVLNSILDDSFKSWVWFGISLLLTLFVMIFFRVELFIHFQEILFYFHDLVHNIGSIELVFRHLDLLTLNSTLAVEQSIKHKREIEMDFSCLLILRRLSAFLVVLNVILCGLELEHIEIRVFALKFLHLLM